MVKDIIKKYSENKKKYIEDKKYMKIKIYEDKKEM